MNHPLRARVARVTAVLACTVGFATLTSTSALGRTSSLAAKSAISTARCAQNRAAGTVTYVSPFGYGPIPGILDVFAAQKLGYFSAECLKVTIVANSFTSNQLVSAGTATFTSVGSAADTLLAIGGGDNLVSIATLADTSTYVLLTNPDIKKLTQLEGKVLAYHAPMPVMITEMLAKAGVKVSKVTLVNDQTYDATLLGRGRYNALQAYQVNEPLTLTAGHYKFNEWYPAQFKIKGTFNTIVGNGTFVKKHPTVAADFLRAELHAVNYCEGHVVACVAIERDAATGSGATFDTAHAIAEWNLSVRLMKNNTLQGKGIGVQSVAEWQPEAKALRTYKVLTKVPSLQKAVNTKLVASLYDGKQLIWPAP